MLNTLKRGHLALPLLVASYNSWMAYRPLESDLWPVKPSLLGSPSMFLIAKFCVISFTSIVEASSRIHYEWRQQAFFFLSFQRPRIKYNASQGKKKLFLKKIIHQYHHRAANLSANFLFDTSFMIVLRIPCIIIQYSVYLSIQQKQH